MTLTEQIDLHRKALDLLSEIEKRHHYFKLHTENARQTISDNLREHYTRVANRAKKEASDFAKEYEVLLRPLTDHHIRQQPPENVVQLAELFYS